MTQKPLGVYSVAKKASDPCDYIFWQWFEHRVVYRRPLIANTSLWFQMQINIMLRRDELLDD